jgi:CubicO group peptidase (beta-lactamase class C family)
VPVSTATVFPTASVLKVLTATAVMQLAERGRLDLRAPIQHYCPAYPPQRWPITVLDLLRQESGLPPTPGPVVFNRQHFASVAAIVPVVAAESLSYQPGTAFVYANDDYVLLACAIEGASGESYHNYLTAHVLRPAEMVSTRADDWYSVIPYRARSYVLRTAENTKAWRGLWTPAQLDGIKLGEPANADPVDPTREWGAAGYVTTPTDLAHFAIAYEGGALMGDSMRTLMVTQQVAAGKPTGFGLGWEVDSLDGQTGYSVFGSVWTGSSAVLVLPSRRFAVAISTNVEFELPHALADSIVRIWAPPTPSDEGRKRASSK